MNRGISTREELNGFLGADTIRTLHERRQSRTYLQTGLVLAVYGGVATVSIQSNSFVVQLLSTLFLGTISIGWFAAIHECVHQCFHRNRLINHAFGLFWSCPTLLNFSLYKYYHVEHHRFATVDGDPEPCVQIDSIREYLRDLPTIWFLKRFTRLGLSAMHEKFPGYVKKPQQKREILVDQYVLLGWILLIVLLTVFFPRELLLAYWMPLAIYFPLITVTGLPEHYKCSSSSGVLANTRTTLSNRFMQLFYWNNNFHAEHHAFPQMPFYNVSKLHEHLKDRLPHTTDSFLGFHAKVIDELLRRRV